MTDELSPATPIPSGDHVPFLVRVAERLSRSGPKGEHGLERVLWAMVAVQIAQMETGNLVWLASLFL